VAHPATRRLSNHKKRTRRHGPLHWVNALGCLFSVNPDSRDKQWRLALSPEDFDGRRTVELCLGHVNYGKSSGQFGKEMLPKARLPIETHIAIDNELFPNAVDGRDNLSGDSFSVDEHDAVDQVF
jgi:hypothetical protein